MPAPRKYPDEIRDRSVRLVRDRLADVPGMTVTRACRDVGEQLGIKGDTLRNWVTAARVDDGELPGTTSVDAARIAELEKENRDLRRANLILRQASAYFCPGGARPPLSDVDAFVDAHRDEHGVEPICSTLAEAGYQIAPSSYYARKSRKPCARAVSDAVWDARITTIHATNRGLYGVRKVWKALARAYPDEHIARCTVERRMRALGLAGVSNKRTPTTTRRPSKTVAFPADRLERDFTAPAPDRRWVADITYVATWSGFVYVAFVTDLYSRRIVGWRVANHLRTDLALDALEQAIWSRRQDGEATLDALVHHSDHGVQYCAIAYTERLEQAGIEASVGSVGDSFDNAAAEAVNRLYKKELIWREGPWSGVEAVEAATLSWVHWYNHERLHSHCDHTPPAEYEATYYAALNRAPAPAGTA
ncbi:IS3 family transposase [Arsenicicoccus sp. MKL-02]|uniref:IS3 family transposase n=1 Tax=Arsenicicoccus cauae TaxID=2663847 RepID=A0A6I3IRH5_9MICO|nr:IS3 family transposase [Arsenicicoccus cauae]MTB70901.1 IS3 family transposase [Arsenicicoccus cauae]